MNCALTEDIFLNEVDNTSMIAPILGCWRKYAKSEEEPSQYVEVEMIKLNDDGTGIWKLWDDSGFLSSFEEQFTYQVQGCRIIFSYSSSPEQSHVYDFRIVNGHLILIDNYGILRENMEVYTPFPPHKRKQRKEKI